MSRMRDSILAKARIHSVQVFISQRVIIRCRGGEDLEVWLGFVLMYFFVWSMGFSHSGKMDACNFGVMPVTLRAVGVVRTTM